MAQRFADTVTAIWHGRAEIDRFNELVLRAGLNWQQVAMLRSYAKYLRQAGFPYSQSHIETVINDNPHTARSLVELFEALFDPVEDAPKHRDAQAAAAAVAADIDALVSLDTDRVLRAFASMIQATLRTNYFVTRPDSARAQNVLSFKLNPRADRRTSAAAAEVRDLRLLAACRGRAPAVRPRRPRRAALVGPPRGLPHRDPRARQSASREERGHRPGRRQGRIRRQASAAAHRRRRGRPGCRTRNEGVACYKLFISGLLDVTDNVDKATGEVVTPPNVVRRDGDDAYLVVAADKGTATFSDIANEVAKSYGFWLGDAFASGGSVGYDHKAMGITAKGAWEAVKRHFREMGVDTQSEDFTVVGVGDMSGDVFGNGMLLSKHIRLLAAFDHRHIFIDPDPGCRDVVGRTASDCSTCRGPAGRTTTSR